MFPVHTSAYFSTVADKVDLGTSQITLSLLSLFGKQVNYINWWNTYGFELSDNHELVWFGIAENALRLRVAETE